MIKKIITLLSFIFISFGMLTGCGGFIEDDTLTIVAINTKILEDGRTEIVIVYSDEEIPPEVFYIPKGDTGETGAEGNGIKSITHSEPDENGKIKIVIEFTDPSFKPVEIEIENGVSIKSIESVKDSEDNNIGFIIHYTDGTTSEQINIPVGKDGKGISSIESIDIFEDDGITLKEILLIITYTDGTIYECTIPAPKKGDTGNGISSIIGSEDDYYYYLIINYTDNTTQEIQFEKPKSPVQWISGKGRPSDSIGNEGDFYFDVEYKSIYRKTYGTWVVIVVLEESYVVKFDLNSEDAYFPEGFGFSDEYIIKGGNTFYSSNKQVPIPLRAGFKFEGWYTSQTPSYVHGIFNDLTVVRSNMTLYAKWGEL